MALAIFALYAPALRNDFVWDDTALILRDPLIRSWRLIPEGFQHFLFTDATPSDFYRPIQRLTYLLDYAAFVFKPAGYHFTSILCHVGAALALLLLGNEFLRLWDIEERKRRRLAFLAALALGTSSRPHRRRRLHFRPGRSAGRGVRVPWALLRDSHRSENARREMAASQRHDSLLSRERFEQRDRPDFPVLLIAILLLRKSWKQIAWAAVVVAFVGVIYLSLRLPAEHISAPRLRPPAPLLVRPIVVARAFAEYTWLILAPVHLHMERDVESHPYGPSDASVRGAAWRELQTLLGLVLIAAAIYGLVRSRKSNPAIFSCLILAALTYVPVSGAFLSTPTSPSTGFICPRHFFFSPRPWRFRACQSPLALSPAFSLSG